MKIYFKVVLLLSLLIILYLSFISFYIFPKVDTLNVEKELKELFLHTSLFVLCLFILMYVFLKKTILSPFERMLVKINKNKLFKKLNYTNNLDIKTLDKNFDNIFKKIEENEEKLKDDLHLKTKKLKDKLYLDDITHLRNRQALIDDTREDEFLAITLIDIDSFSDINELYGFDTGDKVLIGISELLKDFSKKYSMSEYRMYGNVFAIADNNMMNFYHYENFLKELSDLFKHRAIHIDNLEIDLFVEVTIGVSIAQDNPLKAANTALKKAKISNLPYLVYNNDIDTKEIIEKSMLWKEKIKNSIKQNKVIPFYQGIFNRNKELIKYETLMRLEDINEEGKKIYLPPFEFFDVAIKTKQYLKLSNQVIGKALEDLKRTKKQISINLSIKDILDRDFIYFFDKNIEKIDDQMKSRIIFEILESDYIHDYTILEDFILKYRKQGIKIAIDDFGTGYSNFAHILKIRPDYIKIDGSLIKDINTDKNSYEMVKSIIEFSRALNIKTIAEFIHSEEVFNILYDLGVDEFQGYFLSEPRINIE